MADLAPDPVPCAEPGEEGALAIDERFEYDAPRFYDFDEGSPPGAPAADGWFDTEGPKGLATPLRTARHEAAGDQPPPEDVAPHVALAAGGSEERQRQSATGAPGKASKGAREGSAMRRALGAITNVAKSQQAPTALPAKQSMHATASAAAPHDEGTAHPAPTSAHQLRPQPLDRAHQAGAAEAVVQEASARHKEAAATHVLKPPAAAAAGSSSRPLTEPVPLDQCSSRRHRMHCMETRSMASPFKSTAEQIAAFEGRLPGKSHLAPASTSGRVAPAARKQQQQPRHGTMAALTVPMSPQFATRKRVRPPRFKPREVVEAEEMAAMPKFKARPVDKRILQPKSGQLGVAQPGVKKPTVPEPFALKTDQRAVEHGSSAVATSSTQAAFVFGAQGEDSRVTRSKAAKKGGWSGQPTQPKPFALATDIRGGSKRAAGVGPQQDVRPAKARKAAPSPFQLATDQRGAAEEARIQGMRWQQERAQQGAEALNKTALNGGWKPPPAALHQLTVPQDMVLRSDARALQRRQGDKAGAARANILKADRQAMLLAQQQQHRGEDARRMRGTGGPKSSA